MLKIHGGTKGHLLEHLNYKHFHFCNDDLTFTIVFSENRMRQLANIRRMRDPVGGKDSIQDGEEEKRKTGRKVTIALVPIKFLVFFIFLKEGRKELMKDEMNE